MTVKEFIEVLEAFPQDMEIVSVNDYIKSPNAYIERYSTGKFDENDNLVIQERVEIH